MCAIQNSPPKLIWRGKPRPEKTKNTASLFRSSKQHRHQNDERHDGEDDVQREEIQDEALVGAIAFYEDRDDEGGRTDEHRVDGHLEQPVQAKQPVDAKWSS